MRYRRALSPGGSFFFTVVTYDRRPILASPDAVSVLRQTIRRVRRKHPFTLDAIVILPDHLHCIWTLPDGDRDFSTRWRLIKSRFTKSCDPVLRTLATASRQRKAEQAIWQRRYWEHCLRDEQDFTNHFDYIHYNPVKHGLVSSVKDWPHSSFHYYVKKGFYEDSWGNGPLNFDGIGNE